MKSGKKQFLVLGLGRFGRSLAVQLSQLGHEVLAVDVDEGPVNDIAPHVTQAVQTDVTDEQALQALSPGSFDAAIVAMGTNTRASILVTVLCKEAGVPLVMAKAEDDLHAKVLRKVGADRVIFPERDMAQRIARSLDAPNILELMELSGDYRIAEVYAPEKWCGRTLMDVNVRRNYGLTVIGIRRESGFVASPAAEEQLRSGDILIVLGRQHEIDAI